MHRPLLLIGLIACQGPVGSPRQLLEGFRVAALSVDTPTPETVIPRAAIVVDGRLWSDEAVRLEWYWTLPEADAVTQALRDDAPAAVGARPELVRDPERTRLVLRATAADGDARVAFYDSPQAADLASNIAISELPWTLGGLEAGDLSIDARANVLEGEAVTSVEPSGFVRFSLAENRDVDVRWMATAGTWLELDTSRADWTPGRLRYDDETIELARGGDDGVASWIALTMDAEGANQWTAGEIAVGEPEPGGWVSGRWMPGAVEPGSSWVRLAADDASPTGLVVSEIFDNAADAGEQPTCLNGEPFDPNVLLEQRCTRKALDGAVVNIDVTESP